MIIFFRFTLTIVVRTWSSPRLSSLMLSVYWSKKPIVTLISSISRIAAATISYRTCASTTEYSIFGNWHQSSTISWHKKAFPWSRVLQSSPKSVTSVPCPICFTTTNQTHLLIWWIWYKSRRSVPHMWQISVTPSCKTDSCRISIFLSSVLLSSQGHGYIQRMPTVEHQLE